LKNKIVVNKSKKISYILVYNKDYKKRLGPGEYFRLIKPSLEEVNYYRKMQGIGIVVVDEGKFFGKEFKSKEPQKAYDLSEDATLEDDVEVQEEEEVQEKEEVVEEEVVEEEVVEEEAQEKEEAQKEELIKHVKSLRKDELIDFAYNNDIDIDPQDLKADILNVILKKIN